MPSTANHSEGGVYCCNLGVTTKQMWLLFGLRYKITCLKYYAYHITFTYIFTVLYNMSFCSYLKFTVDHYVESDYTILYLHHGLTTSNKPSFNWLRQMYKALDRKYVQKHRSLYGFCLCIVVTKGNFVYYYVTTCGFSFLTYKANVIYSSHTISYHFIMFTLLWATKFVAV